MLTILKEILIELKRINHNIEKLSNIKEEPKVQKLGDIKVPHNVYPAQRILKNGEKNNEQ